eukprot:gene16992-18704_t
MSIRSPVVRDTRVHDGSHGHNNSNNNQPQSSSKQDTVHLPDIRERDSAKMRSDRKSGKFLSFSHDKQSFTENLIAFFTGNRDSNRDTRAAPLMPNISKKAAPTDNGVAENKYFRHAAGNKSHQASINRRNHEAGNARTGNARTGNSNAEAKANGQHHAAQKQKAQPLKRTDGGRISASARSQAFRPVTSSSAAKAVNGSGKLGEEGGDVGGYECMYKTKQPASRFTKTRKPATELSEYLRKENYRYNERVAKQFLFQKWLKSTETEFPENLAEKKNPEPRGE